MSQSGRSSVRLLAPALLAGLASCAQPTPPLAANGRAQALVTALSVLPAVHAALGQMPTTNQTYSGSVTVAGRVLPLPPGAWIAGKNDVQADTNVSSVIGQTTFVRRSGGMLSGLLVLQVSAIDHHRPNSLAVTGPCTVGNVLYSHVRAAAGRDDQDCLAMLAGPQAAIRNSLKTGWLPVDRMNLVSPPTFVVGQITLVRPDVGLTAIYITNPDLDGVPVDPEVNPALSLWGRDRIDRDPAKKAYVERSRAFLERYRGELLSALGQSEPIPADPAASPALPPGSRPLRT